MKTNTKTYFSLIILVSSLLFTFSPLLIESQVGRPKIKIGALGPLAITPGEDMKKGAELAVSEINAGNGVDVDGIANDFELLVESNSDVTSGLPDTGITSTKLDKLVTDGVIAMLGGFRTEVVLGGIMAKLSPGGPYAIPFLGVGSTAPIYTPYFWRVGPVNGTTLLRSTMGLYLDLLVEYGIQNVTLAREEAAWTVALGGGLGLFLPAVSGGAIALDQTLIDPVPQDATGSAISTILDKVAQNGSMQAILTLFSAPVGKTFVEQWTAKGLNENTILAGINVESQKSTIFIDSQASVAGEITLEFAPPGIFPTTKSKAFIDAYTAKNGEAPTYTSFASYDAVYIIKDAIERAKSSASADIQTALLTTDYLGTTAQMRFTNEPVEGQAKSLPFPLNASAGYKVHDLFTTASFNTVGFPFPQAYFSQWAENGVKIAVWPNDTAGMIQDIDLPPYKGVLPSTDTDTATGPITTKTTTTSDTSPFPGFGFLVAVFSTVFVSTIVMVKRRKKT